MSSFKQDIINNIANIQPQEKEVLLISGPNVSFNIKYKSKYVYLINVKTLCTSSNNNKINNNKMTSLQHINTANPNLISLSFFAIKKSFGTTTYAFKSMLLRVNKILLYMNQKYYLKKIILR